MAFGGALGGLAAALLAPKLFSEVLEYPLLLALSMACRPGVFSRAAMLRFLGSAAALAPASPARRFAGTRLSEDDRNELLVVAVAISAVSLGCFLCEAAGELPGPLAHVAGGLQAQERGAVQGADQDQGDPGPQRVGPQQVPERAGEVLG